MASNVFSLLAMFIGLLAWGNATALEKPHSGSSDDRVTFIRYDPSEVVKLVGHYGFSTHIQFSPTEEIKTIALGDEGAWTLAPEQNHLFIKPSEKGATTNMHVITTRRVYNFELEAHWPRNGSHPHSGLTFQINFLYPGEISTTLKAEHKSDRLHNKLGQVTHPPVFANWNYWSKGSKEVTPSRVFDDRRFTFMTFGNNKEMPAIYLVSPDGSESLVNTHIDPKSPDTIVIHKVAKQLIMRKGKTVACVFNQSYAQEGIANTTGTSVDGVRRVIKGEGGK